MQRRWPFTPRAPLRKASAPRLPELPEGMQATNRIHLLARSRALWSNGAGFSARSLFRSSDGRSVPFAAVLVHLSDIGVRRARPDGRGCALLPQAHEAGRSGGCPTATAA